MKFYNREKELHYLKTYCQLEPNSILFVYGPKSSGKTTVMLRVIEELSKKDDLVFFYYDLREYATPTKEEFLEIFFEKGDKKYLLNKFEINLKIWKFGVEEKFDFNNVKLNDVFSKIKESIKAVVEDDKKPVLIIDELQKLKSIYFNENGKGDKSLLNELFNLFVSLTKAKHLCHVICLTSDTLFIEEIYRNSTLKNASEYYLIDWLREGTIRNILKEEGFNEGEINYCLNYLSLPYEISQLINNKKLGLSVEQTIKQWINIEADGLRFLIASMPDDLDESKTYEILGKFKDNIKVNDYEIIKRDLIKEFKFLVENEILFYDVINGIIKPTSIIEWHAIKEVI
ncbi:ATPase [Methanocaldococcus vulcanius M7]|uniref:ATPase n=1 Tax=Methanocaldococcus vulcanius (strain ATCC 700851 / DSM 12094 / M7) TaxID=579137 RepID=C9RHT9_METVM|nr:ATP-binding protein [Methanocaldococcus vulcanius]ACX73141.1 ATPase [Methanocaldococcus vulcanius M7]